MIVKYQKHDFHKKNDLHSQIKCLGFCPLDSFPSSNVIKTTKLS